MKLLKWNNGITNERESKKTRLHVDGLMEKSATRRVHRAIAQNYRQRKFNRRRFIAGDYINGEKIEHRLPLRARWLHMRRGVSSYANVSPNATKSTTTTMMAYLIGAHEFQIDGM